MRGTVQKQLWGEGFPSTGEQERATTRALRQELVWPVRGREQTAQLKLDKPGGSGRDLKPDILVLLRSKVRKLKGKYFQDLGVCVFQTGFLRDLKNREGKTH